MNDRRAGWGGLVAALAAALVVTGLAACATPGPGVTATGGPPSEVAGGGSPPRVVATYEVSGGFLPVEWSLLEGPKVVVTSDGVVVADHRRRLTLSPDELADLLAAQRRDLEGLGPTPDNDPRMRIADAPSTQFMVDAGDGKPIRVSAYALSESLGYPPRLLAARDRMEDLAQRVLRDGSPFTSDRIRLVLEEVTGSSSAAEPVAWPAAVAIPPVAAAAGPSTRVAVLTGEEAATAAALLPDTQWRSGSWPVLVAPDGTHYAVAWRYLTDAE